MCVTLVFGACSSRNSTVSVILLFDEKNDFLDENLIDRIPFFMANYLDKIIIEILKLAFRAKSISQ